MIDPSRLLKAYEKARGELLAERTRDGHWVGELSSSALSTATAVSALALAARYSDDPMRREACRQLAAGGAGWLARHQNADGGWGDTTLSRSNVATTLLVRCAMVLAEATGAHRQQLASADRFLESQGGLDAVRRRYGEDRTFAAPILANAALAGLAPWCEVPALPFELACLPFRLLPWLRLPVVSYAIPALVAIGQVKFHHDPSVGLLRRWIRRLAIGPSLGRLQSMQPPSGGFLEAVPLTSFVVMSLASTGRAAHDVARRGVAFLLSSFRPDGSWPIDTNLATWNTTLAISALASATGEVGALGCLDWLLDCQHQRRHPFTQAAPGGWGWSDAAGAVPDADDTAGALLALSTLHRSTTEASRRRIERAAAAGIRWLLALQNADGGWPTFCRGWGALPFDRSGTDLTAHAMRALWEWRGGPGIPDVDPALERGLGYLAATQRDDGSWAPLWFGNEAFPGEENPIYGTSRVLLAYRDLGRMDDPAARRGLAWLAANQGPDGGWGQWREAGSAANWRGVSSVEETSVALEALLGSGEGSVVSPELQRAVCWLIEAVEAGRHRRPAPIGFYFAKLWYHEKLYPLVFSVSALGRAVRRWAAARPPDGVTSVGPER